MGKSAAKKKKAAAKAQAQQSQSQKCDPPVESKSSNDVPPPQLVNGHGDRNGVEVEVNVKVTSEKSAPIIAAVPQPPRTNLHPPGRITSTSHQGTNIPVSKKKLTLPPGFESKDAEIPFYYDYNHDSLNRKPSFSKVLKGNKPVQRGGRDAGLGWTSKLVSTAVEKPPELRMLENGYDLEKELHPWCCFGGNKWNARRFAHDLSTDFSSPAIGSYDGGMWGTVDFVSDWANIKALIKSNYTESHLSYFVNRVGNSVTIDQFDLGGFMLFPDFLQLPEGFKEFVSEVLAEKEMKKKLKEELDKGKSNESVLRKEAYHQLLHKSMKSPMVLKRSGDLPQALCKDKFLYHTLLSTGKYKILVGSDVPTYTVQLPDANEGKNVTVRSSFDEKCTTDALDLWLDNLLMQCSKTLVTQFKDSVVTKTDWIETGDLPKTGKFDGYAEHTDKILTFIHENVKPGESYWLYRAPGTVETKMYNISNISRCKKNGPALRIFENWKFLSPYVPFFDTTYLTKYSELISELIPDKLKSDLAFMDLNGLMDKNGTKIPENKTGNKSQQKLGHKLENLANLLESRLKNNCGWLIRGLDDINISKFSLMLECLKGLYDHSMKITPCLADQLRRHAVERYLLMCLKLRKLMLDKAEQGYAMEIKKLKGDLRQRIIDMNSGLCGILSRLKEWYDEVDIVADEPDPLKRVDWKYFGCRLHILFADSLSIVSDINFESPNKSLVRRLDQNLPSDTELELAVELLNRALKLVPENEDFEVKYSLMQSPVLDKTDVSQKKSILNELAQKISVALIKLVSCKLSYPAFLYHDFDASISDMATTSGNDGLQSMESMTSDDVYLSVIRKSYEDVALLVDQCIYYGEQVKDASGTEFDLINPLWRANGLKKQIAETIFSLDNFRSYEFVNYDYLLVPESEDIFRRQNRGHVETSKLYTFSKFETAIEKKVQQDIIESKSMRDREALDKVCESFTKIAESVFGTRLENVGRHGLNRDDFA